MHNKFGVILTYVESYAPNKKFFSKINEMGIIQKRNKVELWFLWTSLQVIARHMHTKYGGIQTYGDKVMHRTRNAL